MKNTIFTAFILFACMCNAADFSFHHTFKDLNPDTNRTLYKGTKEIYVSKEPTITASAILDFSVIHSPIRTNRHEWTHQISIKFSDEGRELLNRMIQEKDESHLNRDSIAIVLNDHVIFTHSFDPISKRTDGRPDLTIAVTLSESDYEYLSQEQKKKTPNQTPQTISQRFPFCFSGISHPGFSAFEIE